MHVLADFYAGDPSTLIGGSTIIALVSISVTLLIRTAKVVPQAYIDQIDTLEKACVQLRSENTSMREVHRAEMIEVRDSNARCERRTDRLIAAMRAAGTPIPEEVWHA